MLASSEPTPERPGDQAFRLPANLHRQDAHLHEMEREAEQKVRGHAMRETVILESGKREQYSGQSIPITMMLVERELTESIRAARVMMTRSEPKRAWVVATPPTA